MEKIVTASQMQAMDRCAIEEFGIPGILLMENAGLGIARALRKKFPDLAEKKVMVFAGKGNNGGDGFVVSRDLFNEGTPVEVVLLGKIAELKADAKLNAEIARNIGVPIREIQEDDLGSISHNLRHCDIIVDAIFGTGLKKAAAGIYQQAMEKINQAGKFVVAVDIPSGLDSDTGQLMGPHIRADLTLALALRKRSHLLYPAAEVMGEVQLVDISLPQKAEESIPVPVQVIEEADVRSWFQKRPADSHKGLYGHVLVIAGSRGKGGAAGLTALAALRAGCGLVTLAVPVGCQKALEIHPLEVMTVPLPETRNGCMDIAAKDLLLQHCQGKSAVAVGPGISTEPETVDLLHQVLPRIECPLVIDADGLNGLARDPGVISSFQNDAVLTPHPGEMSRLTGLETRKIQSERIETASGFAEKYSVTLVLKGAPSLIAFRDGTVCINPTGNPGLATAGSGDVLTGIIAGFMAQGLKAQEAAMAGTYVHGLAGDLFSEAESETTLIAGDLLRTLPDSLKRILP